VTTRNNNNVVPELSFRRQQRDYVVVRRGLEAASMTHVDVRDQGIQVIPVIRRAITRPIFRHPAPVMIADHRRGKRSHAQGR
jgi:hypothetical protein